jgi:hypothetical protein
MLNTTHGGLYLEPVLPRAGRDFAFKELQWLPFPEGAR